MSEIKGVAVIGGLVGLMAAALWWPGQLVWGGSSYSPHSQSRINTIVVNWPSQGQSAIDIVGLGEVASPPTSRPVPIASVAKVMTAYVVLRDYPLTGDAPGFTMTLTAEQAQDAAEDRADGQSTVPVEAGEQLSEREALEALLLPSANNIAIALAEHVSGGVPEFVATMNQQAQRLGMRHTIYTDPSGLEATTISTARDQLGQSADEPAGADRQRRQGHDGLRRPTGLSPDG